MKHLKTFENENFEYNIGDYVMLKDERWILHRCVKIIDTSTMNDYYIETFLSDKISEIVQIWVDEEEIERLATPEEIEEYEAILSANKYNL